MQTRTTQTGDDSVDLDELGAVEIELGEHALGTSVARRAPNTVDSDKLLVTALNAVARLRDTVDRLCIFDQVRQMLEHEQKLLDQQIAREHRLLTAIIQNSRARMLELHARRETVRGALNQRAACEHAIADVRRAAANHQRVGETQLRAKPPLAPIGSDNDGQKPSAS